MSLDTLSAMRRALEAGETTAVALTEQALAAAEAKADLNAFLHLDPTQARAAAEAADARRQAGEGTALTGIPLAVKDIFCSKGDPTTAASKMLANWRAPYDATAVARLKDAGAVLLGKLNLDEFAMGASGENSAFGPTLNPWDRTRVPGGSSSGSAAAVAAGIVPATLGTDTGGSIRQPAAFTGTVGLKPTYGRCSRWGIVAFASSLDQAGPITHTVRDAAMMLTSMASFDKRDTTSVERDVPDYEAALTSDIKGLRVGIPQEYRVDNMPAEIEKLWQQGIDWLKAAGAEIVDVSLPHTKYALPAYYIIAPAEASSNLARYDGVRYGARQNGVDIDDMYAQTRAAGFGDEVKRRVMIGTYALSAGYYDAYYVKALQVRRLIAEDFTKAYEKCDVLLTPTTPSAAFPIGKNVEDPLEMYLNDVFTVTVNLAGLPGISVPAGLDADGLPLGLQLIGKAFGEEELLRTAGVLEEAAGFDAQPQDWWSA